MTGRQLPTPRRVATFGLSYREITDADLPVLRNIYASTRAEEVALTGWPADERQKFLDFQFEAQHSHYQKHYPEAAWLLINQGIIPVGRLYLENWTRELRIIDIAFLTQFRRRGWGGAVLGDLMEDAAKSNRAVSIHVEKQNPAMKLYERLGFQHIEDKGVYDLMEWRK